MNATATHPVPPVPAGGLFTRLRRSTAFLPLVGLIAISVFMIVATDNFLSWSNLQNIALQSSINAIIAVGMTAAILTGGIDLSVGAVVALSGTLASGMMVQFGLPPMLAVPLGLGVGVVIGLFNGYCVAYLRMPPIIVTLATMGIARGIALIYTGGYPIDGLPDSFAFLGGGFSRKLPRLSLGCSFCWVASRPRHMVKILQFRRQPAKPSVASKGDRRSGGSFW